MYISLLLLASVATAAVNRCKGNKSTTGYCDTLTYEDVTTRNTSPPTTLQCESTCSNILTDAGDWPISFEGKPEGWVHQIAYADCAFSVGRNDSGEYRFNMDNQDIVDILDEVNKRFGPKHGGRVSARGTMRCEGHVANWYVD